MLHLFLFALPATLVLNRLLGREKIEVVHAHSSIPALAAMTLNKLRRRPAVTVYTTHWAGLMRKLTWLEKLTAFPEILALRWADHVIVDTPVIKRQLISQFRVSSSKIDTIYEGIALDEDEVKQFLSEKTGTFHQSNILLCVGGISSRKNQFSVVKAIPKVIASFPGIKFVFAGPISEAKYFNSIQKFITENNLSPWVEFKGMVTSKELYNLYSEAMLFLFPTTAESQGVVLLEAMAFGLPVIASTIEPIVDVVIQEEGSAILVDPYDVDGMAKAIIQLLEDSSLRQSMSQRGEKLAERLSHEHIAAQMIALYNRLVQNMNQS